MKSKMNSKMTAGSNGIAGRKCIGITTETDKCWEAISHWTTEILK